MMTVMPIYKARAITLSGARLLTKPTTARKRKTR